MRLRVLGIYGPYPKPSGACSGYLLQSRDKKGDINVLIDCGSGVLSNLLSLVELDSLRAVILSHLHYDHMSDMLVMKYALEVSSREALDVYLPRTPENVRQLLEGGKFNLHTIDEASHLTFGEMNIDFMRTAHPVEGYAMRVREGDRVFVFTSDTNVIEGLADFARDCDLLMADAAFTSAQYAENRPHMSSALCGKLASQANAKRLILTHLTPSNPGDVILSEAREYYPEARLIESGSTIQI